MTNYELKRVSHSLYLYCKFTCSFNQRNSQGWTLLRHLITTFLITFECRGKNNSAASEYALYTGFGDLHFNSYFHESENLLKRWNVTH